jgi:putative oxidoreductase
MDALQKLAPTVGRVLLSLTFLMAGIGKFSAPEAMGGYMQSVGLPSFLLYPSAIFEVLAAIALIVGWQARWVALLLAGFTLLATAFFHMNLADQMQQLFFLKNLAIAGGLLAIFAYGAGAFAVDKTA